MPKKKKEILGVIEYIYARLGKVSLDSVRAL
jgi:hypothetical protein